ncbi:MAG: hypothetical protein AAF299_17410 [Pseudomonadota bacterium]
MADVLEFLVGLFATFVYGTKGRPKHPIWRNTLRTFVFGGCLIAVLNLLGVPGAFEVPIWLIAVWLFCFVTVMLAEYYVGKPWLSLVTLITGVGLLGWVIF